MTTSLYAAGKVAISYGGVPFVSGNIKVVLVDDSYTPNFGLDTELGDVPVGSRMSNSVALSGKKLTSSSGFCVYNAADVTFQSVLCSYHIVAAVMFLDTTDDATSTLIGYFDYFYNLPIVPNGCDIVIAWPPSGIFMW